MADKKATHIVVQSGLYFGTNTETGRLEEMAVDTQLTLSDKQAETLVKRGMVKSLKETKTVDVSDAKATKAAEAKAAKEAKAAEAKAAKEAKAAEAKAAKEAKAAAGNGPPPPVVPVGT